MQPQQRILARRAKLVGRSAAAVPPAAVARLIAIGIVWLALSE
jgi:hypothetical protein